ncbi:MAG: hypothetical protein ACOYMA_16785 [Bacteroidia bacterium]
MINDVKFPSSFSKGGKPTKKELLQQLLDLEDEKVGDVGKEDDTQVLQEHKEEVEVNDESIVKPKKKLTEKQLEALKKGQQTRDANAKKRREEAERKAEEDRKIMEAKIVRKAISIKKKEIKKQAALDEISDDDTPIQKIKEISIGTKVPVTNGSGGALGKPPLKEEFIKPQINFF